MLLWQAIIKYHMAFWRKKTVVTETDTIVKKKKKPLWREWFDAALFAVVAATLIRTFLFEAYTIPSASMEGTLLINDYLFVSKLAYGPRIPMTPLAVPLVHNTMPLTGGKSYTEAVEWGYHRLPGFGHVERNDIVVFNGPSGDTSIADDPEKDYYQQERQYGHDAVTMGHTIVTRPVDKKENLIKRCIGIPGDVVEVRNKRVYVNGQPNELFPHSKLSYVVVSNGMQPAVDDAIGEPQAIGPNTYIYDIANDQVDDFKKAANVKSVEPYLEEPAGVAI